MCDSTCDFTAEQAAERGVTILPFHYVEANKPDGGLSGDDDLFQSRSAHEFYDAIRHGACPMTSQPSQLEYDEAFREAYESGVPTVLFCISSGLSGGYEGARMSLERLREQHPDEEVRIYVVDTLVASTPLTLLVQEACRKRDAGLNAEQIVNWAEEARYYIQGYFTLDSFDALARGGRIPPAAATVGGKLDIKPELSYDLNGALTLRGMCRGRKKALRAIIADFKANHLTEEDMGGVPMPVGIVSADAEKDAQWLGDQLRKEPGCADMPIIYSSVSPVIGAHVGPGMVACVFWGKNRTEKISLTDRIANRVRGAESTKA